MRTTTLLAASLAAIALTTPAMADVCAINSKAAADKAVRMLSKADVVLRYCAPCGDTAPTTLPVTKAAAAATADDPAAYEVSINGTVEDVAYLYAPKSSDSKKWVNVGLLSGCAEASDIDTLELPPGLAEKASAAQ